MKTALSTLLALVLVLAASACGNDNTSPSSTSATPETFTGVLSAQGSVFYSFTVAANGIASITLASLSTGTQPGPVVNTVVGLGVGVPTGTGCGVTNSASVVPGLSAQLSSTLAAGIYCVQIFDLGNVTVPLNFAILIAHT